MGFRIESSRNRFLEYLNRVRLRNQSGKGTVPPRFHSPSDKPQPKAHRSILVLLREFFQLARGQRTILAFSLGTLTFATLLKLVPPAATKIAVDHVLVGKPLPPDLARFFPASWLPWQQFTLLAVLLCAVSITQTIVHLWGRWHATRASKQLQSSLRKRVFAHSVRLPLHRVQQLRSGGVSSILREDAGAVGELVFSLLYNPWRAIIQLVGSLVILAFIDWRLLIGAFLLLPLIYISHRTWVGRLRPMFRDVRKQREEVDAHSTEAFSGMRVVRAFGQQRGETSRFVRGNHLMARQELLAWAWSRGIEVLWEIALPILSMALMLYGGWAILRDELTLGDLTMFLFYLAMLFGPLEVLANSATGLQTSLAALDRILDLLNEPLELAGGHGVHKPLRSEIRGAVTLRDVSFSYPGNPAPVLQDINLEVELGEMIALVGPSGAGKTTLCNLIARFFDPTQGVITLDGIDLKDFEVDSYRRLLGIVEQDVFLFDGTVAENIGYSAENPTLDQIRSAARLANAAEFIEKLELQYETRIGERGVRLSGGQRQRIAIARALLADPRILILDEATSNLDSESEQLIQRSLAELMRERTSFVIAHRLSTIRHADRILVLEQGRIAEVGSHAELMETSGSYRKMIERQSVDSAETLI